MTSNHQYITKYKKTKLHLPVMGNQTNRCGEICQGRNNTFFQNVWCYTYWVFTHFRIRGRKNKIKNLSLHNYFMWKQGRLHTLKGVQFCIEASLAAVRIWVTKLNMTNIALALLLTPLKDHHYFQIQTIKNCRALSEIICVFTFHNKHVYSHFWIFILLLWNKRTKFTWAPWKCRYS